MTDDVDRVKRIAELARERKVRVVTSESLTSGTVAATMNSALSGFSFRSVSAMCVPSMLLTKCTFRSRFP